MTEDLISNGSDDIFFDESIENQSYESRLHSNLMKQLETNFQKEGFREGILITKDKFVQHGFDQGFEEGLAIGGLSGQLLGASWALKHLKLLDDTQSENLCNQVQELDFEELMDKAYFECHPVGENDSKNLQGWKELLPDISLTESEEKQYYFKDWYTECKTRVDQAFDSIQSE